MKGKEKYIVVLVASAEAVIELAKFASINISMGKYFPDGGPLHRLGASFLYAAYENEIGTVMSHEEYEERQKLVKEAVDLRKRAETQDDQEKTSPQDGKQGVEGGAQSQDGGVSEETRKAPRQNTVLHD